MQVNIYRTMHGDTESLEVSGEIHPANLGYWLGHLFEFDCDIRLEILGDGNEKEIPSVEEDVDRTIH